jgi:glycine betaine/proline transport system substrate-binding protein
MNVGGRVGSAVRERLEHVERAVREKRPIVFLGWQPHPMNDRFRMRYLMGGDSVFGPNFGSATVSEAPR